MTDGYDILFLRLYSWEGLQICRPLDTSLHQNCLERSQICQRGSFCAGNVHLLRQQYIMQCLAWIHTQCFRSREGVQRQGVSTLLSASQHSEKVTKTEQQRLLLCSGSAWEVVSTLLCPPSMCGAGSLIYIHSILQALGKEQCWGMWTAEELGVTFSLSTARNPTL